MDPSRVMVGRQAAVLVDNVPGEDSVLLLNRGLFTVYVGGPYVDGAATGVPLAPLGSLAVTADRQWYAVADPAAQGAAQAVYRVPGGTSYSPAPSEIAAQIQASQLAAQIGAAVPVPPSAIAIGTEVGNRVPVPPTAAAIGAAVPVPPSAAAIGAAVPVPPSAAAIGAAVPTAAAIGAAVPVPPSAAAIGAAVPVPPSAAAIGAAVPTAAAIGGAVPVPPSAAAIGAAVPSATAIASGLYTQGVRAVDGPARTVYNLGGAGSSATPTIDVSQAQSIDIVWDWRIGTARAAGTQRAWAQLRIAWLDDAGSLLQADAFELCNTNPLTVGANSTYGALRVPAMGSKMLISFESTQYGAAGTVAADSAFVSLLLSQRPTDRTRYYPADPGNGATPGPAFTGILLNLHNVNVPINFSSAIVLAEPLSADMDVLLFANTASVTGQLFRGSAMDGPNNNLIVEGVPLTAGQSYRTRISGIRSQIGFNFINRSTTTAASVYAFVVASDK